MAHDFAIRNKKNKDWKYFFGFAQGLMYHAFHEEKHFAMVSGDGGAEDKNKQETEKALDWAIQTFDRMGYPDPTRLDEIKQFRKDMVKDPATDTYQVYFG